MTSYNDDPDQGLLQNGMEVNHRYKIDHLIGRGGYGEVYKGIDQTLGREVAIKVLYKQYDEDPERQQKEEQRFINEARITAQLIHSSLPITHDFGSLNLLNGEFFIVCEYLKGVPLSDRIAESPLSVYEALEFVVQSAGALAVAHARGILHRDLKPSNIFCMINEAQNADPSFKVLDFGIAKVAQDNELAGLNSDETREGLIVGTPRYMAPERLQGKPYGAPSDLYGLGVIFYNVLMQSLPFTGENIVAVLLHQINGPIPRLHFDYCPPELLSALQNFFEEMIEVEPNKRIQTAKEVKDRAQQILIDFKDSVRTVSNAKPVSNQELAASQRVKAPSSSFSEVSPTPMSMEIDDEHFGHAFGSEPHPFDHDPMLENDIDHEDEYTSAKRISKGQLKLLKSKPQNISAQNLKVNLEKGVSQRNSYNTPTPVGIEKVNIKPITDDHKVLTPNLTNPVVSALDVNENVSSISRQELDDLGLSPANEKKKKTTLIAIAIGFVFVCIFTGIFLSQSEEQNSINAEINANKKSVTELSVTSSVQKKPSKQDLKVAEDSEVDLDIDTIELEVDKKPQAITKTSKRTKPLTKMVKRTKPIAPKRVNKPVVAVTKKRSKKHSTKSDKKVTKPSINPPKKVTLSILPRKPTYLVGNKLKLKVVADGSVTKAAKITIKPSNAGNISGQTLSLKKDGRITIKACIKSVCSKRKLIVYEDLFSDFE